MAQRSNRRFLNLISEEVFEDRVSYIGRGRADSIMARSLGLHLRPNTLAQTKPSSRNFRLQFCGGPYIPIIDGMIRPVSQLAPGASRPLRVRMEGWRQAGGDVRIPTKWSSHEHRLGKKNHLDTDRSSHGRNYRDLPALSWMTSRNPNYSLQTLPTLFERRWDDRRKRR